MNTTFSPLRVLAKALCLFVLINLIYAVVNPSISKVSGYNVLFPGRTRLPFGSLDDPYTISVNDLDTMFASHAISATKLPNEFRVAVIGDSSVWGENLGAHEVISEQWNELNSRCGDKIVRVYDLGYPHPSVVKDLVIIDKVVEYKPDLIIWLVTLNTLMSQRVNAFLAANPERLTKVLTTYDISFNQDHNRIAKELDFFEKTMVGQRSNLTRQIKLQMLGVIWIATGADTSPSKIEYLPNQKIDDDPRYHGIQPPAVLTDSLLAAGQNMAKPVPILIINEPIFITNQAHVVRYNVPYPRWAFDQYREAMASQAEKADWKYLDLWNAVPPGYFSEAGLHVSAAGERILIERLNPAVQSMFCRP